MKNSEAKKGTARQRTPFKSRNSKKVRRNKKGEASRQRPPFGIENQVISNWLDKAATYSRKLLIEFVTHALVVLAFQLVFQQSTLG